MTAVYSVSNVSISPLASEVSETTKIPKQVPEFESRIQGNLEDVYAETTKTAQADLRSVIAEFSANKDAVSIVTGLRTLHSSTFDSSLGNDRNYLQSVATEARTDRVVRYVMANESAFSLLGATGDLMNAIVGLEAALMDNKSPTSGSVSNIRDANSRLERTMDDFRLSLAEATVFS